MTATVKKSYPKRARIYPDWEDRSWLKHPLNEDSWEPGSLWPAVLVSVLLVSAVIGCAAWWAE